MTCNLSMTLPPKIFKSISLVFCINTFLLKFSFSRG